MSIKDLHAAASKLDKYELRFLSVNAHLPAAEFAAKWDQDVKDRAEAAAIQAHRDEKVLQDAKEIALRAGTSVSALVEGLELNTDSGQTSV